MCFCTRRVDVSALSLPADSLYTITRKHTPVRHGELLTFPAFHIHVVDNEVTNFEFWFLL